MDLAVMVVKLYSTFTWAPGHPLFVGMVLHLCKWWWWRGAQSRQWFLLLDHSHCAYADKKILFFFKTRSFSYQKILESIDILKTESRKQKRWYFRSILWGTHEKKIVFFLIVQNEKFYLSAIQTAFLLPKYLFIRCFS